MTSSQPSMPAETYVLEGERYVLYVGSTRALTTDIVAVLIDTRLPMLITHGDPASVRRELDAMRDVLRASRAPHDELDWLLLEGRPDIAWLNHAIAHPGSLAGMNRAFSMRQCTSAQDIARRLLKRIARLH